MEKMDEDEKNRINKIANIFKNEICE